MARTYHHGSRNKKVRFGDNWQWYRQEPKEWRRLYKHKKRRAKVRELSHRVMRGNYEQNWPLDSKPWIYYW